MDINPKTIVSGIFKTEKDLSEALEFLDNKGVPKEDMSILMPDKDSDKNLKINTSNKIPEVAIKGFTSGSIIGGIFGSLSFVGILIVPTVGIAIAGPIIGALAGIAAGSILGTLIGAAIGITIPEYEAKFFSNDEGKNILLITKVDKSYKTEVKNRFINIGATNIAVQ